jgi:hypothetical protein
MIRIGFRSALCVWATLWITGLALAAPAATAPAADASAHVTAPVWADCPKTPSLDGPVQTCPRAEGYHGIWYYNQNTKDEYAYKYSGGLGTYPSNHIPFAIYAQQVDKTFFVYGGVPDNNDPTKEQQPLLIMVSYYDHKTGQVPRPVILMDKKTTDAHDNAVLSIDERGYIWVFAAAHGTGRPAYLFKSAKPYEIDAFQCIWETNFSYPEPWYVEGKGFLFLHTRYVNGHRVLHQMTSPDGITWSQPQKLAEIEKGHYQVSWRQGNKVATAFNFHPTVGGLNARTNLYYMETTDFGQTWTNVKGEKLTLPLTTIDNPALVHNYAADGKLVYIQDLNFDAHGKPLILYNTSRGWQPGPKNGLPSVSTAHWARNTWQVNSLLAADHNYDDGSLYVEKGNVWRIIAPTLIGRDLPPREPQPYGTGGEMVMWTTNDAGRTWFPQPLTSKSLYNHCYARRPVNANPDFYAYWADGDARKPSVSRLYFASQKGEVFRLPETMTGDFTAPQRVPLPPETEPAAR